MKHHAFWQVIKQIRSDVFWKPKVVGRGGGENSNDSMDERFIQCLDYMRSAIRNKSKSKFM